MKFITEEELRDLYKKEPFTDYKTEPGTRITPGARQFLIDRGIRMFDEFTIEGKKTAKGTEILPTIETNHPMNKRLYKKMKSMEALLFVAAQELLNKNVLLAQTLILLSKRFAEITQGKLAENDVNCLGCKYCTGINETNFSECLEDCFEINEFHIQLDKGKEIVILNQLRCALREIEEDVLECETATKVINQIINALSQLICINVGGETCQKKS